MPRSERHIIRLAAGDPAVPSPGARPSRRTPGNVGFPRRQRSTSPENLSRPQASMGLTVLVAPPAGCPARCPPSAPGSMPRRRAPLLSWASGPARRRSRGSARACRPRSPAACCGWGIASESLCLPISDMIVSFAGPIPGACPRSRSQGPQGSGRGESREKPPACDRRTVGVTWRTGRCLHEQRKSTFHYSPSHPIVTVPVVTSRWSTARPGRHRPARISSHG